MASFSTEVARPPAEVFAYVTDPARFVEWQKGVVAGRLEGEEPHGVGDRCVTTRRVGFSEQSVTSELTHLDPPRTWGVRGLDGPIRATVDVTVEGLDADSRSRVTIELDFDGHGVGKLLVPLFVMPASRKDMPTNLQRLKQRLETV